MLERFRGIGASRLRTQTAVRPILLFAVRKTRVMVALAFCAALLAGGTAFALQHGPRGRFSGWAHPPAMAGEDRSGPAPQPSGREHLPEWYRQHQNLSLQEQERALRAQPGFDRLPPWKQQRLCERLRQLDAMPPLRRERTLERMEALERLSPEQRRQVRMTMQEVMQMPIERRRRMRDAFETLSQTPPPQRQGLLNSPEYRRRFSPHELEMLATLMTVEPYTPSPSYPGADGGPPR